MSEVIIPRAVDRAKYKGRMLFIDGKGNICLADIPKRKKGKVAEVPSTL